MYQSFAEALFSNDEDDEDECEAEEKEGGESPRSALAQKEGAADGGEGVERMTEERRIEQERQITSEALEKQFGAELSIDDVNLSLSSQGKEDPQLVVFPYHKQSEVWPQSIWARSFLHLTHIHCINRSHYS